MHVQKCGAHSSVVGGEEQILPPWTFDVQDVVTHESIEKLLGRRQLCEQEMTPNKLSASGKNCAVSGLRKVTSHL